VAGQKAFLGLVALGDDSSASRGDVVNAGSTTEGLNAVMFAAWVWLRLTAPSGQRDRPESSNAVVPVPPIPWNLDLHQTSIEQVGGQDPDF
jgi:hypothetical protein